MASRGHAIAVSPLRQTSTGPLMTNKQKLQGLGRSRRSSIVKRLLSDQLPQQSWRRNLQFIDDGVERDWLLVLEHERRKPTFWLQVVGTVVFLLLVLTDVSVVLSVDDKVDTFTWWKVACRLATGAAAALILALEACSTYVQKNYWRQVRSFNVLLACVWSVVFAPTAGLAKALDAAPFLASCGGGSSFTLQEIRLHPASFLLLFAGPVLESPFLEVVLIAILTTVTEVVLNVVVDVYGSGLIIADHIAVSILLVCVSAATAFTNERSARTFFFRNRALHKENMKLSDALSKRNLGDEEEDNSPNITSNSEKLLELLQSLQQQFGENEDLQNAIQLMQRGGMFAPDLSELEQSDAVDDPIKQWLLTGPAQLQDQKLHMRRTATSLSTTMEVDDSGMGAGIPLQAAQSHGSAVDKFMRNMRFDDFNFDVFAFSKTTSEPMAVVAMASLLHLDAVKDLNVPASLLSQFLSQLDGGYKSANPYHNATHAASVTWDMQYYLGTGRAQRFFTKLEVFACVIAAACHDYKHPGRNNQFLVSTRDSIALMYNDVSVLENFHSAETFRLGLSSACPLFTVMAAADFKRFREVVVSMVLATDVSRHFKHVAQLKTTSLATATDNGKSADVDLLSKSLIMVCDLGHGAKAFNLHEKWTARVTEEFFRQGDAEREAGMKISPLCDRATTQLAASQVGFFNFLVMPLFEAFNSAHQVTHFRTVLMQATSNLRAWKARKKAVEASQRSVTVSAAAPSRAAPLARLTEDTPLRRQVAPTEVDTRTTLPNALSAK